MLFSSASLDKPPIEGRGKTNFFAFLKRSDTSISIYRLIVLVRGSIFRYHRIMPKSQKAVAFCYIEDPSKGHYLIRSFLRSEFRPFVFSKPEQLIEALAYSTPDIFILEDAPLELLLGLWDGCYSRPVPYIALGQIRPDLYKKAGLYLELEETIPSPWSMDEVLPVARKQLYMRENSLSLHYRGVSVTKGKNQRCYVLGEEVPLSRTPKTLLAYFLQYPRHTITREKARAILGNDFTEFESRDIDFHISELRKGIPLLSPYLQSIYGKGYMLK